MSSTHHLAEHNLLTKVPTYAPDIRAREVVAHLMDKKHEFESITYIYVLEDKRLTGVLSVKELLRAHAEEKLRDLMVRKLITVHPHATLERAAITAIQHGIKSVPVVDRQDNLVGVVGTDTILHTLHREHTEDLLRMGGVQIVEQKHIMQMIGDRVGHLIRIRLPWLVVGLVGGFIATIVVSRFESILSETVALAFFMPLIVYMSAAVGAQTQTIFIRASAIKKLSAWNYAGRELLVDGALGIILAILLGLYAVIFTSHARLAFAISAALFIAVVFAGVIAVFIPWLLMRLRRDPALGAGPFGTVVQDILSLLVYFLVASALL